MEGLNVEDGVYTWYMSVKDGVADWFNMETGEALCRYEVTSKDELLQEIYLEEIKNLLVDCWMKFIWRMV